LTTPAVDEPVAGYDSLSARDVVAFLSSRSRREQAAIESYERAHRNRQTVLSKLRRLRQEGPARVPQALSTEQVVAALRRFRADRVTLVSRDAKR
jgi:hypothetical protein